jgi:hypothetical protein
MASPPGPRRRLGCWRRHELKDTATGGGSDGNFVAVLGVPSRGVYRMIWPILRFKACSVAFTAAEPRSLPATLAPV